MADKEREKISIDRAKLTSEENAGIEIRLNKELHGRSIELKKDLWYKAFSTVA